MESCNLVLVGCRVSIPCRHSACVRGARHAKAARPHVTERWAMHVAAGTTCCTHTGSARTTSKGKSKLRTSLTFLSETESRLPGTEYHKGTLLEVPRVPYRHAWSGRHHPWQEYEVLPVAARRAKCGIGHLVPRLMLRTAAR